jgi:radical SAM protein with 4Fe4S-binding SPASM domain
MECNLGFDDAEIAECLGKKGLLSIELEFTKKCNLRCLYCYSSAGKPEKDELTLDEIKSVILQAKELGAKKIILLGGGEPLLFQGFCDIVKYIDGLGLKQILFTNGTLITEEIASILFKTGVPVIVKNNSCNPDVQDFLAGVKGVFDKIKAGTGRLMDAGYPSNGVSLGMQTVICRQNIDELPSMWVWARENSVIPYFEILTYQGRLRENGELLVPVSEIKALFDKLRAIDRESFDIQWSSRPTIASFSCKRHLYSCLINSQGNVQPCTGIDMHIGNVRDIPLKEILANSAVVSRLRNIYDNIEGECKTCEHNYECYGCRGNAYQLTGNYLASDPTCWHHAKATNEDFTCLRK